MKEKESAADKLRRVVTWLDYQDENFNTLMTTPTMILKVFNACQRYGYEFADDLDTSESEQRSLAKKINAILQFDYYIID